MGTTKESFRVAEVVLWDRQSRNAFLSSFEDHWECYFYTSILDPLVGFPFRIWARGFRRESLLASQTYSACSKVVVPSQLMSKNKIISQSLKCITSVSGLAPDPLTACLPKAIGVNHQGLAGTQPPLFSLAMPPLACSLECTSMKLFSCSFDNFFAQRCQPPCCLGVCRLQAPAPYSFSFYVR